MISAALNGALEDVDFINDPVFGLSMPVVCAGVPDKILNPKNMWSNKEEYDARARELSIAFVNNFRQFEPYATEEMMIVIPKIMENTV